MGFFLDPEERNSGSLAPFGFSFSVIFFVCLLSTRINGSPPTVFCVCARLLGAGARPLAEGGGGGDRRGEVIHFTVH